MVMFTLRPRRVDFKVATTCRVVSQCEISDQSPVSIPEENPPSRPDKGFRLSHRGCTVDLVFHVGLSLKILLAIMGDRAHRMNGESQVRSQN
jgi:hypothetical protein